MSYKTILVHVDDSARCATRIALAAQLARQFDAHLVGAALTGVSRYFYQEAGADLLRTVLAPYMDELIRKAQHSLDEFGRLAQAAGVHSHETRLIDDETGAGLALAARYADLVVLGQSDPDAPSSGVGGDLAAWLMLACPRPVLVVPAAGGNPGAGRHAMLAWNGSAQAVRAASAALPLLARADSVTVASFGTPDDPAEPDPDLAAWLRRHGIDAGFAAESALLDTGERLLSLLADRNADLLVMGGYGHARLSELLLGGVTRTILRAMTVPVLLAH